MANSVFLFMGESNLNGIVWTDYLTTICRVCLMDIAEVS